MADMEPHSVASRRLVPADHPPVPPRRVGVLLLNLGSPDSPTVPAVRRYLAQFLSDPRVVEIPAIFWKPILFGVILNTRPSATAANYAKIWDKAADESPLRLITRRQTQALAGSFGPDVLVDYAMRYGNPSIAERLVHMQQAGCDRILVAPLYPQYSSATTGTAMEEVHRVLATLRWMPTLRTLPPYYDHPDHVAALARSLERQLAALPFRPEKILLSFHGMPRRTLDMGDPYHCQCQKTARLLREATGWSATDMPIAFQSLFGRAEWLKPYTEPTLVEMAKAGVRRVAVLMPGFSADCIETLEEIALEARHSFLEAGGTDFAAFECLNDSAEGMTMLRSMLAQELAGWVEHR